MYRPIYQYFKNTSYLLVKIAHRFSLENSQNLRDPRGIAPGVLPQYIACATLDLGSPDEQSSGVVIKVLSLVGVRCHD